jgi:hypothetical protein
LINKN